MPKYAHWILWCRDDPELIADAERRSIDRRSGV